MNKETLKEKAVKSPARKRDGSFSYFIFFVLLLAFVIARAFIIGDKTEIKNAAPAVPELQLSFSDVLARQGDIATMNIRGNDAVGTLRSGEKYTATIAYDPELLAKISSAGAKISIDNSKSWIDHLGTWVPILMGVLFIWWIFRGMRGMSGGMPRSLTAANPTKITVGKTKTTFADVAGIDAEKAELMEVVEFLKNRDKFKDVGARVPRGVLLSGEPGTGKTLLARAIAGEANVPFFAASGSDFAGIIVGLGVAKIKEIFEMARRSAPCILFIDEIDAIGARRSSHGFNDQDREQTLNQLLIEMDGFSGDNGIIVIGATNRPDMLDSALLRPGRFDRQVYIELPDLTGRRAILDLYAKKIKVATSVDLQDLARGTTGFSGADLENLLNEAALHAVRGGRKKIDKEDLEEARDKILMGPKKTRKMRAEDIKLTAYHEAGHAFVSVYYRDIADPIHKATIIPRGRALGMVMHLPIDDKVSMTVSEIRANLAISMAGRASEEIFFGPDKITTGAEGDIASATYYARKSITKWGLSEKLGLAAINQSASFGRRESLENASEKTAQAVDEEVREWLNAAHKDAAKILTKNKGVVAKLAEELLKRETLTREEIEEIVLGKKIKKEKVKKKK
ncbi:MAG: ATP-dependent zinc metalloprotease FtsH [Rickettsiales bacterium]|nr:ATP-dependent zinc metalloprotease FtsH [Rickettsiales bacterium]